MEEYRDTYRIVDQERYTALPTLGQLVSLMIQKTLQEAPPPLKLTCPIDDTEDPAGSPPPTSSQLVPLMIQKTLQEAPLPPQANLSQ